jgi:hypothetical protein
MTEELNQEYYLSPEYIAEQQALIASMNINPLKDNPDYVLNTTTNTYQLKASVIMSRTKEKRTKLLQESDWTQLPDVKLTNKEAWATYRQQVREIYKQGIIENPIWPTMPPEEY